MNISMKKIHFYHVYGNAHFIDFIRKYNKLIRIWGHNGLISEICVDFSHIIWYGKFYSDVYKHEQHKKTNNNPFSVAIRSDSLLRVCMCYYPFLVTIQNLLYSLRKRKSRKENERKRVNFIRSVQNPKNGVIHLNTNLNIALFSLTNSDFRSYISICIRS